MIFRTAGDKPTERSCAKEGGLDKATYTANHFNSLVSLWGRFQWKMRPGVAVVPCNVWSVLAVEIVSANCLRCTFKLHSLIASVSAVFVGWATTSTRNVLDNLGSTANTPGKNLHSLHARDGPVSAWSRQGTGGINSMLLSSSFTSTAEGRCRSTRTEPKCSGVPCVSSG